VKLTAWRVPAPAEFSVRAEAIEKDRLQVYDVSGRLQYETAITERQAVKVSHLALGTYILCLAGNPGLVQKVVVQGSNPSAYH
jgi:hypothetical protein